MTARRLLFLSGARLEVQEAFEWYLTRSPRAASRFLAELDRAVLLIRETPDVWPSFEAGTRRYVLHGFPYSIIYREARDTLQVIALAHHKRRPDYWHPRPDA
jgi:plasmid stabilization system protein ParE